jgi:hypothetical protein
LHIDTINDTLEYRFYFNSSKSNYRYFPITGVSGIGLVKGKYVYPIASHIVYDINSYPDSCNLFFRKISKELGDSLRLYKGEINPWLKEEAKRRGIF